MAPATNLGSLEHKAYQTMWEDGLVDICVGLGLLGIGIAWIMDHAALGATPPAILVPIWVAARKRITEPRIGQVEFSSARQAREKRGLRMTALMGLTMLMLGVVAYLALREYPEAAELAVKRVIPALPSALLAVGMGLAGFLFGVGRFLGYAGLLLVVAGLGTSLGRDPGWHLLISGLVVTVYGVTLLVAFLRKYEVPEGGTSI